jgi:uncharacterized protein YkwD
MRLRRWLPIVALTLVAAIAAACIQENSNSVDSPVDAGPPVDQPAIATDVVERVNAARVEARLGALAESAALAAVASAYSCQMAEEGFFSHVDPAGLEVDDRVKAAGISYRQVGENLARNTNADNPAEVAVAGWLESESHRANVLHGGFTETGVGVCRVGATYYFTQLFRLGE